MQGVAGSPRKNTAAGRADCECRLWNLYRMESKIGLRCRYSSCKKKKHDEQAKKVGVAVWGHSEIKEVKVKMSETDTKKEPKRKFALWIKNSTLDLVESQYKTDNCMSKSEFIEKAVIFYTGFLSANQNEQYIPNVVSSTIKSIVDESDKRMSRMIFKLAVELSMTMNIIAAMHDIDEISLERLRGECIKEVRKHNGTLTFDDAYKWQKG